MIPVQLQNHCLYSPILVKLDHISLKNGCSILTSADFVQFSHALLVTEIVTGPHTGFIHSLGSIISVTEITNRALHEETTVSFNRFFFSKQPPWQVEMRNHGNLCPPLTENEDNSLKVQPKQRSPPGGRQQYSS